MIWKSRDAIVDGTYRYWLMRQWVANPNRTVLFIMLNPSIANALVDDNTVTKCVGFAKRWGFERLLVCNLYAHVATDPADLFMAQEHSQNIVGPQNDEHIRNAIHEADQVVLAWGVDGNAMSFRTRAVLEIIDRAGIKPFCIRRTTRGAPIHPSRVGYTNSPVPFTTEGEQ